MFSSLYWKSFGSIFSLLFQTQECSFHVSFTHCNFTFSPNVFSFLIMFFKHFVSNTYVLYSPFFFWQTCIPSPLHTLTDFPWSIQYLPLVVGLKACPYCWNRCCAVNQREEYKNPAGPWSQKEYIYSLIHHRSSALCYMYINAIGKMMNIHVPIHVSKTEWSALQSGKCLNSLFVRPKKTRNKKHVFQNSIELLIHENLCFGSSVYMMTGLNNDVCQTFEVRNFNAPAYRTIEAWVTGDMIKTSGPFCDMIAAHTACWRRTFDLQGFLPQHHLHITAVQPASNHFDHLATPGCKNQLQAVMCEISFNWSRWRTPLPQHFHISFTKNDSALQWMSPTIYNSLLEQFMDGGHQHASVSCLHITRAPYQQCSWTTRGSSFSCNVSWATW